MIPVLIALAAGLSLAYAVPAPSPVIEARDLTAITAAPQLSAIIATFEAEVTTLAAAGAALEAILLDIVPPSAPDSIPNAVSRAASAYSAHPTDFYQELASLVFNGVVPGDIAAIEAGFLVENSNTNILNPPPKYNIYPKKSTDAPYDVPELTLRAAMYIPPGFTYGAKQPGMLTAIDLLFGSANGLMIY